MSSGGRVARDFMKNLSELSLCNSDSDHDCSHLNCSKIAAVKQSLDLFPKVHPFVLSNFIRHRDDDGVPGSSARGAQLTIFYKGSVNVYDDVSVDQARAIMLLANESCLSAPVVKNVAELQVSKTNKQSNPPHDPYKIQTSLPIATRRSLRLFFDKRRDRIMNRFPYVPSSHKKKEEDESSA